MYITINSFSAFMNEFTSVGREYQFSYEAMEALFEYYDELENFELDVIAVCCEWAEYDNAEEALEACGAEDIGELQDNHFIIELENGHVLVQD